MEDVPDITSAFIDLTYDAAADAFVAQGFALTYDDGGGPAQAILNGSFLVTATIDATGAASAGTLAIGGDMSGFGPSLLTATLVDFGFVDGGGSVLEFLFQVDGGDLAPAFALAGGGLIGVIMGTGIAYGGDWSIDYDNLIAGQAGTGSAVSDTAPIPAPGGIGLLALAGLGGALGRRGRDRQSRACL
jgi:MYXO-CTERM domain-containing protein